MRNRGNGHPLLDSPDGGRHDDQRRQEEGADESEQRVQAPRPRSSTAATSIETEKAKILKQWELDARLLQVATEEGMGGGEHSLFADVKKAQQSLDVDHLVEDGAPTKVGP